MGTNDEGEESNALNVTYFYDFIRKIQRDYPPASWLLILEEIEFARDAGPIAAQLRPNSSGAFELIVPIGFGRKALIELEFDQSGALQPVMGGVIEG